MPLADYLRFAAQKGRQALQYADGWQGVAFTFTRYLKGHPDLADLDSWEAADVVDQRLAELYPESENPWVELLGNQDSRGHDCEPFDNFVESWDSVKHVVGEAPLDQALRMADERPIQLDGYRSPRWRPYLRFLSIARWLQFAQDGENIYLPVRRFGELLGVSIKTVSNYRRHAERGGLLILVKKHEGRIKATEYRFNLERLRSTRQAPPPAEVLQVRDDDQEVRL